MLKKRFYRCLPAWLVVCLTISFLGISIAAPTPVAAGDWYGSVLTLYEYYNAGDDSDSIDIHSSNWTYQCFTTNTTTTAHTVTKIKLLLKRTGTPGTVTLGVRTTSGNVTNCQPAWEDIATSTLDGDNFSTTAAWQEFEFTEFSLSANTTYCLVLRALAADSSNYVTWRYDSTGTYPGGHAGHSHDGGVTWTEEGAYDFLFEIWGHTALDIVHAKVFSDYLEDGDWLITCLYFNAYPPYYNAGEDVSSLFYLQLVDNTTVKAQTKVAEWGYKPGALYLSAAMVTSLQWGGTYTVRMYGDFPGTPYEDYILTAPDWMGEDLNRLDTWVRSTAKLMEDYYGTALTEYVAERGFVLNETGGVTFTNCIPCLSNCRPGIYKVYATNIPYTAQTWTHAGATTTWQVAWGPYFVSAFNSLSSAFGGVSGGTVAALFGFLFYAVIAGLAFPPGHAIAAITIPFGILMVMWYTALVPLVALGVLLSIAAFWIIWQIWLKGG